MITPVFIAVLDKQRLGGGRGWRGRDLDGGSGGASSASPSSRKRLEHPPGRGGEVEQSNGVTGSGKPPMRGGTSPAGGSRPIASIPTAARLAPNPANDDRPRPRRCPPAPRRRHHPQPPRGRRLRRRRRRRRLPGSCSAACGRRHCVRRTSRGHVDWLDQLWLGSASAR